MKIITPTEIEQVAWEGTLAPLGATFKDPVPLPRVTIGEPAFWSAEQALEGETGKKWSPPATGERYTLVRLACTLHPPDSSRTRYAEATLTADLRPRQGERLIVAHDLYPQRLTAEDKGSLTSSSALSSSSPMCLTSSCWNWARRLSIIRSFR